MEFKGSSMDCPFCAQFQLFQFCQAIQSIANSHAIQSFKAMPSNPKPTQSNSIPLHSANANNHSVMHYQTKVGLMKFHRLLASWYNVPSFPWCKNLVKAILINCHWKGFIEKTVRIVFFDSPLFFICFIWQSKENIKFNFPLIFSPPVKYFSITILSAAAEPPNISWIRFLSSWISSKLQHWKSRTFLFSLYLCTIKSTL